jgi:hypothetical protein
MPEGMEGRRARSYLLLVIECLSLNDYNSFFRLLNRWPIFAVFRAAAEELPGWLLQTFGRNPRAYL